MVVSWTLKKGDYGVVKEARIISSDGTPRDLTGMTVKLKVWRVVENLLLIKTLEVTEPTDGKVKWTVAQNDLANIPLGVYSAEIELIASGYVESTETFQLNIMESG